jgi:hypothetical protein
MNEINHFKIFVICSGDVVADLDHLHENSLRILCGSLAWFITVM